MFHISFLMLCIIHVTRVLFEEKIKDKSIILYYSNYWISKVYQKYGDDKIYKFYLQFYFWKARQRRLLLILVKVWEKVVELKSLITQIFKCAWRKVTTCCFLFNKYHFHKCFLKICNHIYLQKLVTFKNCEQTSQINLTFII